MSDAPLIAYVGSPEIHDSVVEAVDHVGSSLRVRLRTCEGRHLLVGFEGVAAVMAAHPVGMMLYALAEVQPTTRGRRFVFANWEERDADDSALEVEAESVRVEPLHE